MEMNITLDSIQTTVSSFFTHDSWVMKHYSEFVINRKRPLRKMYCDLYVINHESGVIFKSLNQSDLDRMQTDSFDNLLKCDNCEQHQENT